MGFPFVFIHPLSFYTSNSRILTEKTNLLAGIHGARVCPYIIYHTGPQQPLSQSSSTYSDLDIFEAVVVVNIISRHSNLSSYLVTHDLIVMESAQVESQAWFWQIPMTPIPQPSAWQISCEKYFLTDFEFHDLADSNTADLCPQCWSVVTVLSMFTRTAHLAIKSSQLWLLP